MYHFFVLLVDKLNLYSSMGILKDLNIDLNIFNVSGSKKSTEIEIEIYTLVFLMWIKGDELNQVIQ